MYYPQSLFKQKMFLNAALLITLLNFTNCNKGVIQPDTVIKTESISVESVTQTPLSSLTQSDLFDAAVTSRGNLSAYQQVSGNPYTAMVINPACMTVVNDPVYGNNRKVIQM